MTENQQGSAPDIKAVKRRAKALAGRPSTAFYDLACALAEVKDHEPTYLREIEKVSGIKRRRLYYLTRVGTMLREWDLAQGDVDHVGWTKLQIVARHVGEKDGVSRTQVMRYLKLAERTAAADLPDVLGPETAPDGPMKSVLLRLTADQYAILEEALLKHGAEESGNGLKNKELAVTEMAKLCNGPTATA